MGKKIVPFEQKPKNHRRLRQTRHFQNHRRSFAFIRPRLPVAIRRSHAARYGLSATRPPISKALTWRNLWRFDKRSEQFPIASPSKSPEARATWASRSCPVGQRASRICRDPQDDGVQRIRFGLNAVKMSVPPSPRKLFAERKHTGNSKTSPTSSNVVTKDLNKSRQHLQKWADSMPSANAKVFSKASIRFCSIRRIARKPRRRTR